MSICELLSLDPIKTGDTFEIYGVYKISGVPSSLLNYTITSQVRDNRGLLIATLPVYLLPQTELPGQFRIGGFEIDWPVGAYKCDIQFIDYTDYVRSTETFLIPVEQDITHV